MGHDKREDTHHTMELLPLSRWIHRNVWMLKYYQTCVSNVKSDEKRHKIQGTMHGRHPTGAGSTMKEVLAAWRQLELLEFLNGRLRRGG